MKAWGTVAPAIGGAGHQVGATGHVPLPKPSPTRPGSDIVTRLEAAHARVSPIRQGPRVDPDALERLRRLGVLVEIDAPEQEQRVLVRRPAKKTPKPRVRAKRNGRPPQFDRARMVAMYEDDMSVADIAAELGCNPQTVHKALRAHGVPRHERRGMPAAATDAILRAGARRRAGIVAAYQGADRPTMGEVAERLGYDVSTVARALKHEGVPARRGRVTRNRSAMVAAYVAGSSIPEVAERFGVSVTVARRTVVASGVPRRDDRKTRSGGRTVVDEFTAARIVAAYQSGHTTREAGALVGLSQQTVSRTLRSHGIEPRTAAEAQKGRPGADGARHLKDLMAAHGIHSGDVRAWARTTGRPIPDRGLPPKHLVEAYLLLHPKRGNR